jgi:hypothetical protein
MIVIPTQICKELYTRRLGFLSVHAHVGPTAVVSLMTRDTKRVFGTIASSDQAVCRQLNPTYQTIPFYYF